MNRYNMHSFSRPKQYTDFNVGDRVKYNAAACQRIIKETDINFFPDISTWRGSITHKSTRHSVCVVVWDHLVRKQPYDSEIAEADLIHE